MAAFERLISNEYYDDEVRAEAERQGFDPDLAVAVHRKEYDPNKWVSSAGARGQMQLMPATAKKHGVNPDDSLDNIKGGVAELKYLHKKYKGNTDLMLAAYNAGEVPVDRYGGVPPYKETLGYVTDVKARYAKLKGKKGGAFSIERLDDDASFTLERLEEEAPYGTEAEGYIPQPQPGIGQRMMDFGKRAIEGMWTPESPEGDAALRETPQPALPAPTDRAAMEDAAGTTYGIQPQPSMIPEMIPEADPGIPVMPSMTALGMGGTGQLVPGNIDLANRPQVKNADGTVSTVLSKSFNMDGKEVLIPTVSDDGKILSDKEAVDAFMLTGKHLGIFATPEAATAYADRLHGDQADIVRPEPYSWPEANLPSSAVAPPTMIPQTSGKGQGPTGGGGWGEPYGAAPERRTGGGGWGDIEEPEVPWSQKRTESERTKRSIEDGKKEIVSLAWKIDRATEKAGSTGSPMWQKHSEDLRQRYSSVASDFIANLQKYEKIASETVAPQHDFFGGLKVFALNVPEVFKGIPLSLARMMRREGQQTVDEIRMNWLDRYIDEGRKRQKLLAEKYGTDERTFLGAWTFNDLVSTTQSLGYSLSNMILAIPVGFLAERLIPGSGVKVGATLTGATSFRMTKDQVSDDLINFFNDESKKNRGTPLSDEEVAKLKTKFDSKTTASGLWEAIPEAIGNALEFGIVTGTVERILKTPGIKKAILGGLAGFAGTIATETATEWPTQYGQSVIEADIGMREKAPTIFGALKEVAPVTIAQASIMAIVGGAGATAYKKLVKNNEAGTPLSEEELGELKKVLDEYYKSHPVELPELPTVEPVEAKGATETENKYGLTPNQVAWIEKKIREVGDLDTVMENYDDDSDVSKYAREIAPEILGEKAPKEITNQTVWDYQDSIPEKIVHRDWDVANPFRHDLEGAGDILRELTKSEFDPYYVGEKIRRIERLLETKKNYDTDYGVARKNAGKHLDELIEAYRKQPIADEKQAIARDAILSVASGDYFAAKDSVAKLKSALQLGEPAEKEEPPTITLPDGYAITETKRKGLYIVKLNGRRVGRVHESKQEAEQWAVDDAKAKQELEEEKEPAETKPPETEFSKGDRVTFKDGRHGEIVDVETYSYSMLPIFGAGETTTNTSTTYIVKTDNGSTRRVSDRDGQEISKEAESPGSIVEDPVLNGEPKEPEHLLRIVSYEAKSAKEARARADRARKPEIKKGHALRAKEYEVKYAEARKVWDAWAEKYPEEALEAKKKGGWTIPGEEKKPPTEEEEVPPAGSATDLSAYGLKVTKTTTKSGKTVWEVTGNTKEHMVVLKEAGGRWYSPRKAWSFYKEEDPTGKILEKLSGKIPVSAASLGTNSEGENVFEDEAGNRYVSDGKVRNAAPRSVGGRGEAMRPYTVDELYEQGRTRYLTEAEVAERETAKEPVQTFKMGDYVEPIDKKYLSSSPAGTVIGITDDGKIKIRDSEGKLSNWQNPENYQLAKEPDRADQKEGASESRFFTMRNGLVDVEILPVYEVDGKPQQVFRINGKLVIGLDELKREFPPIYDKAIADFPDLLPKEAKEPTKVEPEEIKPPVVPPTESKFGADNKIFTEDKANKAREILRKKLGGIHMGAPIDPEVIQAGIDLAGYYIEGGSRSFVSYAKKMITDLGDAIRPYLKSFYMASRNYPGFDKRGMDNESVVDGIDENAIDISEGEDTVKGTGGVSDAEEDIRKEPAQRPDVVGASDLDVGEPSGENAPTVPDEETEKVPGSQDRPGDGERGAVGEEGATTGAGTGSGTGVDNLPGKRPGTSGREPAEGTDTGTGKPDKELGDGHEVRGKSGSNNRIGPEDVLFHSGKSARISANIKAIETLKKIEAKDRPATDAEKKVLQAFSGWGAVAEDVFRDKFDNYVRGHAHNPDAYYYRTPENHFNETDLPKYRDWESKYGKKLHPVLGGILTEEEWEAAAESGLNAHYTSPEIISAMWQIAERLGIDKGRVLEPAAGVGHFLGLLPENLVGKVKLAGIELDSISGRILDVLYPKADIQVTGFENAKLRDNHYDMVISNFPFGDYPVHDSKHPNYFNWSIHNYFFARSLDAVKPGGLVLAVTSRYTMDSTKNGKTREYLGQKADFVGAIRLPGKTFSKNAGTDVTTDIIILRKKTGTDYPSTLNWRTVLPVNSIEGESYNINEYFVSNPEMVLGLHSSTGSMHGDKEYTVIPRKSGTLDEHLQEAIKLLPENITKGEDAKTTTDDEAKRAGEADKEGTFVIRDGKLGVIKNGFVSPVSFATNPAKMRKAKEYVGVLGTYQELIDAMNLESTTDAEIELLQAKLNKLYDKFAERHGRLNNRENKFLHEDDNFVLALSLEDRKTRSAKKNGRDIQEVYYEKGDVFTKRTIHPFVEPSSAENIEDAADLSMTYRNAIDQKFIAGLLKEDEDVVKQSLLDKGLAFENPENGLLEHPTAYLSGNVRKKLRIAEEKGFQSNAEALKLVQPEKKYIDEIPTRLGDEWIPPTVIESFAQSLVPDTQVTVNKSHVEAGGEDPMVSWTVSAPRFLGDDSPAFTVWGAEGKSLYQLMHDSLNLKRTQIEDYVRDEHGNIIYDERGESKTHIDKGKSLVAQQKQREIQAAFRDYVLSSEAVGAELAGIFNEEKNNYVIRTFSVPDIKHFPNASRLIDLRDHQKKGVARGKTDSTIFAHSVGTGKTYLYTTLAMELKRTKAARKPMIVVQGSTISQFAASARKLYPGAKIFALTKDITKGRENRRTALAKIASGDWDVVIIPHSTFNLIGSNPVREMGFIQEQLDEIKEAIRSEGGRDPGSTRSDRSDSLTVKQLRKILKRKEARLQKLRDKPHVDNAIYFEDIGVDGLLIDEAHTYKRGDFFTKMENIKGLDRSASQKSFDFLMKVRHVQEKTEGKNIYLASGTPITNTLAEIWTIMRYTRPELLREYGAGHFDGFASMFTEPVLDIEPTETGEYKYVERLKKYRNGYELMNMWLTAADVILQEDVPGWKDMVPALKDGSATQVTLDRSPELSNLVEDIRRRRKEWDDLPGKEKMEQSHIPLTLRLEARKASIDLRLIHPENPDIAGGKANSTVDEIFARYLASMDVKGTQLAFSDLYQSPDPAAKKKIKDDFGNVIGTRLANEHLVGIPRFNLFEDIKKKLIAKGIPADQIAIITDKKYDKDEAKERLFEMVNDGSVRVVLGGTEKLGIGVNAQERMVAIHNIDVPTRPMDLEQRIGRLIRPGNMNKEVEVVNYVIVNSFDAVGYGILLGKMKFTNQILRGNIPGSSFEDPTGELQQTLETLISASSGNPLWQKRFELENNIRELNLLSEGHTRKHSKLKEDIARNEKYIEVQKKQKVEAIADAKVISDAFEDGGKRVLSKGEGKNLTEFPDAVDEIQREYDELKEKATAEYEKLTKEQKTEFEKTLSAQVKTSAGLSIGVHVAPEFYAKVKNLNWKKTYSYNGIPLDIMFVLERRTKAPKTFEQFSDSDFFIRAELGPRTGKSTNHWGDEISGPLSYGETGWYKSARGMFSDLHTKIESGIKRPDQIQATIDKETKNIGAMKDEIKKPFQFEQKLKDSKVELEKVYKELETTPEAEEQEVEEESIAAEGDIGSSGEAGFIRLDLLTLGLGNAIQSLWKSYKGLTPFSESKKIIGEYTGAMQEVDLMLSNKAREINAALTKDQQIAITNYIQADGDMAVLQARASASTPGLRKGYLDAMRLTADELRWADIFRDRHDDLFRLAADEGIIESYVENYVRGQWVKPNPLSRSLIAQAQSGVLNTKPREAMRKVFKNYFEGEQAGYVPADKRIGFQWVAAERSIRQAIEARKAMAALNKSVEADGRRTLIPAGGSNYVPGGGRKERYLVNPFNKGRNAEGYKNIDHPALRKWKWVDKDSDGKPVFVKGDLWVHPKAFNRLNAILGRSRVKEYMIPEKYPIIGGRQPGLWALKAGGFIKGTILIGPFHQFHVGEHALFHKVSPFMLPEIDFNARPLLREGVTHGLMLFNHNALYQFCEGLATGGLWHRIPIAGEQLIRYQTWLFQDYIPKLKAAMFEHAVARAEHYYARHLADGRMTRDQLLDNVAKQANAAFGEQNYEYIGRNKTVQDFLRLGLLAPDFLESRMKFAGQALRPYGKEQAMALLRGAAIMAISAQIINLIFSDDHKIRPDKPFTVIIGKREYTPRSVVADILHLVTNPRSFWYHRLNPLWGRPLIEIAHGYDFYGRRVNAMGAAKDVLKAWTPIPAQGLLPGRDMGDTFLEGVINSTLTSIGISNYPHKTKAEQKVFDIRNARPYGFWGKSEESALKNDFVYKLRKAKTGEELKAIRDKIDDKVVAGKITTKDKTDILIKSNMTPLESSIKGLTADEAVEVFAVTDTEEALRLAPIIVGKVDRAKGEFSMDEEKKLLDAIDKLDDEKKMLYRQAKKRIDDEKETKKRTKKN